jgi:hypothetical protein
MTTPAQWRGPGPGPGPGGAPVVAAGPWRAAVTLSSSQHTERGVSLLISAAPWRAQRRSSPCPHGRPVFLGALVLTLTMFRARTDDSGPIQLEQLSKSQRVRQQDAAAQYT